MRKSILAAASALAFASPAVAADLPVTPYTEAPSYEYRAAPPVVVEEPAPVVVVRRPVIVAPPPVVVDPVYAAPRVYVTPRVFAARLAYAYGGPVWRNGWGHGHHFRGRW